MDQRARRRGGRLAAVGVVVATLVAACGGGSGDDAGGGARDRSSTTVAMTPELRAVVDGAREEGQLLLSWQGVLGSIDGAPALIKGFKDLYDLDIDVRFTPGSGQGEMATKVEQEQKAGLPATTDLLSLNGAAVEQLAERDVIQPVDWSFAPHLHDPEHQVAADGRAVEVQQWLLGIAYNTQRVDDDEAPTTMADLLDPALKGRVYTTPFGGGFDLLASDDSWGRERTLEYARRFAKQVGGLGFNVQPLLTGEFDVMALLVPPGSALAAEEDGAPIRFVVPTDAALLYQNLVSIPTNSAHPNAARLFVDYLVSPEGQAVLRKVDHADSPLVEGSLTGRQIAEAEAHGATFVKGDVTFYARQDHEQYQRNARDITQLLLTRDG